MHTQGSHRCGSGAAWGIRVDRVDKVDRYVSRPGGGAWEWDGGGGGVMMVSLIDVLSNSNGAKPHARDSDVVIVTVRIEYVLPVATVRIRMPRMAEMRSEEARVRRRDLVLWAIWLFTW